MLPHHAWVTISSHKLKCQNQGNYHLYVLDRYSHVYTWPVLEGRTRIGQSTSYHEV